MTLSLDQLSSLTRELERDVPSVRGSFPDFEELSSQLHAATGRTAIYALGTIKSGKSTFLSSLVASDALPRGSGVKTFNISRVHATAPAQPKSATVHFKTPSQLAKTLAFDLRMLGVDGDVPEDPYDPCSLARLQELFAAFKTSAAEDGRLEALSARQDETGLLVLAVARVEMTLSCLERLHRDFDQGQVRQLRETGRLDFKGDAFDNYRTWAGAPDLAVIIQEIDVGLSFPPRLPENLTLVDCQGSDSLNPLDFASVDAALHRAERIFYVVSSRLGLRGADRDLLTHVRTAGLDGKASLIYNVEAFEPFAPGELEKLTGKLAADLEALKLGHVKVYVVCALYELLKESRPEEAAAIKALWTARSATSVLTKIEAGFDEVTDHLQAVAGEALGEGAGRVVPLLVTRAQTTAKALLARDRQVFGLQSSELDEKEVRLAVRRILDGERAELHKRLTRLSFETFDNHAAIQKTVDEFLTNGAGRFLASHPVPDDMKARVKHGPIMGAALEAFNTEWTHLENKIRLTLVNPFIEQGFKVMLDSLAHMHRLIPGVLGPKLAEVSSHALPSATAMHAALRERLDRAALATAVPEVMRPIVLLPAIANGLAAEFYARGFFGAIKAKVSRKAPTPEADAVKVARLWERTATQIFRAAKQDTEFSVSSARENFRFQFFGKIADALYARFEELIIASAERYFADLRRLTAASKLLLNGNERQRVEEYLRAL